ncbi:hypothetical protein FISHEDRAFT_69934 [Fistulina hepatica ATCC 64428]|uniref:Uncharacterized protein n=1 Tax=Fistulina hepatica ATCC 64428 TaxID=1128425 RepID=A0A0D7AN93_9AGAR|nr:hypothetical protein FISHEDRAFT_69934 [Fistulina hepatica ATCC 64428]
MNQGDLQGPVLERTRSSYFTESRPTSPIRSPANLSLASYQAHLDDVVGSTTRTIAVLNVGEAVDTPGEMSRTEVPFVSTVHNADMAVLAESVGQGETSFSDAIYTTSIDSEVCTSYLGQTYHLPPPKPRLVPIELPGLMSPIAPLPSPVLGSSNADCRAFLNMNALRVALPRDSESTTLHASVSMPVVPSSKAVVSPRKRPIGLGLGRPRGQPEPTHGERVRVYSDTGPSRSPVTAVQAPTEERPSVLRPRHFSKHVLYEICEEERHPLRPQRTATTTRSENVVPSSSSKPPASAKILPASPKRVCSPIPHQVHSPASSRDCSPLQPCSPLIQHGYSPVSSRVCPPVPHHVCSPTQRTGSPVLGSSPKGNSPVLNCPSPAGSPQTPVFPVKRAVPRRASTMLF